MLADALVQRRNDLLDRSLLVGREALRLRLAVERLANGRGRSLAPRRAAQRGDELERAGGRRAVVVGDPEREVDERRRDLVEQPADEGRLDARGSLDADVRNDAAGRAPPEADGDDRALADALRHLVRERLRQRAGRDERIDRRERHGCTVAPAPEQTPQSDACLPDGVSVRLTSWEWRSDWTA